MSDSKFRIPRVAVAALVLGGACSDGKPEEGWTGFRDRDPGDGDGRADAGGVDRPTDGGLNPLDGGGGRGDAGVDAGGVDGGRTDGGADAGRDGGSGALSSRAETVARAYCDLYEECDPEAFDSYYSSKDECVREYASDFLQFAQDFDADCALAAFDAMECAAKTDCTDTPEQVAQLCRTQLERARAACPPGVLDGSYDSPEPRLVHKARRKARIPR